jgi:superfamily I DNA and/or RNA helicase
VLQRRMHPTIATLINTLFYSDQQWYSTRPDGDGGVAWINTHDLHPNVMREPGSRSLYNPKEKDVVNELVQGWVKQEQNVLVVSPYSAQVTSLMLNLDRSIRVRTIDGCQGVEADVVIVSFVTFNFSDARDFVVDPKRMNVAFSRAREVLYLVGDLDELRHNIGRMPPSNAYHHLVGLAELFGETGHFRECVQRWEP